MLLRNEGDGDRRLPDHSGPRVPQAVADPGLQQLEPLEQVVSEGGGGQDDPPEGLEGLDPEAPVLGGQPGVHPGHLPVQHLGAQDHGHAGRHAELADEVLLVHSATAGLSSHLCYVIDNIDISSLFSPLMLICPHCRPGCGPLGEESRHSEHEMG